MRSSFRAIWGAVPICAWLGLVFGVADLLSLIMIVLINRKFILNSLGVEVGLSDWLRMAVKSISLEMLTFILIFTVSGLIVALLLSVLVLIRGGKPPGPAMQERLVYLGLSLLLLLMGGVVIVLYTAVYTMFSPSHSILLVIGIAALYISFMALILYGLNRLLARYPDKGALWLYAGGFIWVGALFLLGLRELALLPHFHRLIIGPAFFIIWTLVSWGLLRMTEFVLKRLRVSAYLRPGAVLVTGICVVIFVFTFLGHYRPPPESKEQADAPNVILIVLDTVRVDHLSAYGYARPTTPVLERLAKEGVLFDKAFSAAPWTMPSHASFFTGLYPAQHGCNHEHLHLDSDFQTLAESFQAMGYVTLGYSNNPIVGRMSNLDQGFDSFIEGGRPSHGLFTGASVAQLLLWFVDPNLYPEDAGAADTVRVVKRWLGDLKKSRSPFFIFINFMEAHPPYPRQPEALKFFKSIAEGRARLSVVNRDFVGRYAGRIKVSEEQKQTLITLYDGEINYLDSEIGKLLDRLDELKLSSNTIVVVISDHGEMFGEHGDVWGHIRLLYNSLLHVPLLVRFPGRIPPGERVEDAVSLRKIPAMIMALRQDEGFDGFVKAAVTPDGNDVVGLLAEVARPINFMNLVENRYPGYNVEPIDRRQKALIQYPWKLIWDSKGDDALYNLEEDPGETKNRIKDNFNRYNQMERIILNYNARYPIDRARAPVPPMDPETRKRLKALGYLP